MKTAINNPAGRRPTTRRNLDLGRIHQAKKALRMSDEDYREMLWAQARVSSSADLDATGRAQVLHYLGVFSGRSGQRKVSKPLLPHQKKIWALWYALEAAGKVSKPASPKERAAALRSFIKGQIGVDDVRFLNQEQGMNLIERMKKWVKRVGPAQQGDIDG